MSQILTDAFPGEEPTLFSPELPPRGFLGEAPKGNLFALRSFRITDRLRDCPPGVLAKMVELRDLDAQAEYFRRRLNAVAGNWFRAYVVRRNLREEIVRMERAGADPREIGRKKEALRELENITR